MVSLMRGVVERGKEAVSKVATRVRPAKGSDEAAAETT